VTVVMAWPLKRSAFARLAQIAAGERPAPLGAEALVSAPLRPVQVELFLPAEPDRICVFGTPLSFSRREFTGESGRGTLPGLMAVGQVESVRLEVRVRVYEPGEDFESVDRTVGDVCSAVASAVLSEPLFEQGRIYLSGGSQDPTAMAPAPEPSVTGNALIVFTAEVITF
jgi:hypothetical protein